MQRGPVRHIIPSVCHMNAQNPENLLIFAAGNDGEDTERSTCTMGSPAIAKNVLAVGSTTSGSTRFSVTGELYSDVNASDIDTVAYFSSYGPTEDGRIKPEVMAPGDMVSQAVFLFRFVEGDIEGCTRGLRRNSSSKAVSSDFSPLA